MTNSRGTRSWDDVPEELRLLAGLNGGKAVVISEDGVSR